MKILINISAISENHRGMGVFAKQIVKELLLNNSNEYLFVSGNNIDDEIYEIISLSRHKFIQFNSPLPIFEQVIIPLLIIKHKSDICWFPSNTFPLLKITKVKYIATICDLIFLKDEIRPTLIYQRIGRLYRAINIRYGICNLDVITSISRTVINEIYEVFKINKEISMQHILYVAQEFKDIADPIILNKLRLVNKKYIYTIAGTAPHKNLIFLINSFLKLCKVNDEYTLVVSGAVNSEYSNKYPNILFTPFISEEEKTSLIENAELFVFPSLMEGFGIPLIEGLYYNPNILVSDIEIFREIGKDYVRYFDPYNENFLIEYLENKSRININHQEAKEYVLNNFNSKKTAKKLEEVFNEFK